MTSPKPKNAAAKNDPAARDGSNAKPRPRPVRPGSLYTPAEVHEIFRRFSVQRPEPKGELEHVNAFTLLVAVVLSAQATDAGVNKATRALFKIADTPQKMLALGEAKVGDHIRTIGLWRNKAKNVIALSQALIRDHGGEVPDDRDELVEAAGRRPQDRQCRAQHGLRPADHGGRHAYFPHRQPARPGARQDAGTGRARAAQGSSRTNIMRHAHHWLILHGRYVCKARKPECRACVIADICKAAEKTTDCRRRWSNRAARPAS